VASHVHGSHAAKVNVHDGESRVKVVVFGYVIPVIAAHSGLKARGGSEGVGRATTQSVVNASLAVIMLDLVIGGENVPRACDVKWTAGMHMGVAFRTGRPLIDATAIAAALAAHNGSSQRS
jgi:hypothetical protein